ncbi:putative small heat shock protein HSP20 [Helianthus annuus]|uniref:Small heat shock protein HSP20 n=1 Tax=Helianthus annuus TaxID=4232 RepID=A0A9K3IEC8_HELAN|nr:putative small heat shock protein HSP20 [Helianthus annuus]KAJ0901404.1 putative small heat shock protein HSP20 [Helianthus annuus]
MMAAILRQSSSLLSRSRLLLRRRVSASRFFNTDGVMEDTVAHSRIVETADNIHVSVDMPGCAKKGVKASLSVEQLERKSLCIKGRREDKEIDTTNQNYSCNIDLPDNINTSNIKAELVNGLLRFPKVGVEQEGKKWFDEIRVK